MSLASFYRPGRTGLSFELFPPKTPAGMESLWETVGQLLEHKPDFFTCTYGAGGSTRDTTLEIVCELKRRWNLPVASHLTCVGATADQLREYLREARERGVDYIVALRGDPPKGETKFQAVDGGLCYANELVSLIREEYKDFGVLVAGYPEVHQEAISAELDLENLKRKVDSGADVIVTQLFYDNQDFFRFRDACDRVNIRVPIVPGILPVTSLAQIQRIAGLCKAKLPEPFVNKLSQRDDANWHFDVGVEFASRQVLELLHEGIPGIHFYVLNKSQATAKILKTISEGGGDD